MKRWSRGLWLALLVVPLLATAAELPSRRYALPIDPAAQALRLAPLNPDKALAEDALADKGAPLRYAIMHKASVNVADRSKSAPGRWTDVDADTALWRMRIDAPGALSIDLALRPFVLPEGAEVWLSNADGQRVRGPYTAADNPKFGEFWTPYVPGDVAYLEVLVPKARRGELQLGIKSVQQAYRSIETGASPFAKSRSCNVDVVCPEGNEYRDQIKAVARYTISGGLCTGQLINNTAQNYRRIFITASHCFNPSTGIATQAAATTMVFYWKYHSPTCRAPGSLESGTPISEVGNSIAQTGGASLMTTRRDTDTTLVELESVVPREAEPYWLGWDRTTNVSPIGVAIHHPAGDEKRISIENDALVESNVALREDGVLGNRHWRVTDWDVGTTEQGSSGSVLLNADKRLIGVLSGGYAQCGNDLEDYFARLNAVWDDTGPGSGNFRISLDPSSSGVMTLDGKATCTPATVALNLPSDVRAGTTVPISVQISGGISPYTVDWDFDNNQVVDRHATSVDASSSVQVSFPQPGDTTINLVVTDDSGCVTSIDQDLQIGGAVLSAAANGSAAQACGDNDARVEPGEIWNFPVRIGNAGNKAANDGFAVFVGDNDAPNDTFGYRALSSSTSQRCRYQPIDMNGATTLTPTVGPHVSNAGAEDEGFVAGLAVGGSAPFRFYDRDLTSLMMSTNGYLSTNPADGGDDYTPECGLDTHVGVIDGRIQALHDDLVIQSGGSLRHQHFATCPRAADVGNATQGCTVFEWRNMGRWTSGGAANGNAVFQTILYDQSYEIVNQYITADPDNGGNAIIGLQNAEQTTRFDYQCNTPNAATAGTSICFFHPTALPSNLVNTPVHVLNPALAVGNLDAGAQADASVSVYVDPAATCGDAFSLKFLGGVDDVSSSVADPSKVHRSVLADAGNCQVATQCAAQLPTLPTLPAGGVYLNPNRSGNGQNIFNIGSVLSSVWFTGDINRTPIWYLMAGPWSPNFALAKTELRKFTRTSTSPFTVASTPVGTSWFARGDDDAAYINVWNLDGVWGGEKLVRFYSTSNLPTPNHTGGWRNAGESGWGVVIDEHLLQGQASTGMLTYLYDSQNQPRWTLGEQFNSSNTITHSLFPVHCPSCPRFADFGAYALPVGTVTRSYQSQTSGTLDSALTLPPPLGGTWNRTALPIQMITPPLSPSP